MEIRGKHGQLYQKKIDVKTKTLVRDKKGHYVTIKGSTHQKDITFANIYALNIGTPKFVKEILRDSKGEIDKNTMTVGNFTTPFLTMDKSLRQNINTETLD